MHRGELLKHLAHLAGGAGDVKRHGSLGAKLAQASEDLGTVVARDRVAPIQADIQEGRGVLLLPVDKEAGARSDGQG